MSNEYGTILEQNGNDSFHLLPSCPKEQAIFNPSAKPRKTPMANPKTVNSGTKMFILLRGFPDDTEILVAVAVLMVLSSGWSIMFVILEDRKL